MRKKIAAASLLILLISSFAFIRIDYINELRKKINSYNEKYKRTKLDIVFNQPKYTPGDTAYFRALYVSATDLKLMHGRQIIEIDLHDAQGIKVMQKKAVIINGICSSQFFFPSTLPPGIYTLIAYSNWMKNFDSALFFRQSIILSGPNELIKIKPNKVSFYPEGGNFISGVENNLVIKYQSQDSSASYSIKDNSGKQIEYGKFDKNGLAEVKITPTENEQYSIELIHQSIIEKIKLPLAKGSGFALQLMRRQDNQLQVKVSYAKGVFSSNYSVAFLNSSGLISSVSLKSTEETSSLVPIPQNLQDGLTNIVVIADDLKIMAERLIYKKPTPLKIDLVKSKEEFGLRDSVHIQLDIKDKDNNPIRGRYSVSVINTSLFKISKLTTENNLLLSFDTNDLPSDIDLNNENAVNFFLISQSCSWLNWKTILSDNIISPAFNENEYLELKGQLKSPDDKKIPDSTIVSLFLENQIKGYEIITRNNGVFTFPMILDPWGADLFFYSTTYKERDLKNLYLQLDKDDSVKNILEIINFKEGNTPDPYTAFIKESRIINKSFSFYSKANTKNEAYNPNALLEEEFGGADLNVNLNDYVIFPTMVDVVREILPAVEYRKIKDRDVMRVYTTNKKPGNFSGPLFVIDGHLTKEIRFFLDLDPQYVSSIKVINESSKLLRFGALCANGVVIVKTKYPDISSRLNEKHLFEFTGLSYPVKSNPVKKALSNKSIPYLKSCLYWNSDIELDNQGHSSFSFNTSDDVGDYEILVEGISSDGKPFSTRSKLSTHYKIR